MDTRIRFAVGFFTLGIAMVSLGNERLDAVGAFSLMVGVWLALTSWRLHHEKLP
jgi:hypothetical protein